MKHALLALFLSLLALPAAATDAPRWAAYYGENKDWEAFSTYDLIVFEPDHHPPVRPLTGQGRDVLAYISLVEVEPSRAYYTRLKQAGLILEQTEIARPVIDVRNPQWMAFVIEEMIPLYVREGFTGLMLDTVDSANALEAADPARYRGMGAAAAATIRHIRMHYPYLKLMLNRGFEVLPAVQADVDMVLAESIYIDSREEVAQPFPDNHYRDALGILERARQENPRLLLFSLDYWDMNDTTGVKDIYAQQREAGLIPYVSTRDLQTLYAEP